MTLPNFITIARLIAVPVFVWLVIDERPATAFWVFLAAGLSDAADGFIARKFNLGSEFGAYLDPVADKALLVAAFVSLGVAGLIPSWLVIAAVARDFLIVGAVVFSWMLGQPLAMRPLLISKANTLMQITLVCVVLGQGAFGVGVDILEGVLVWTTGALTLASAGAYLVTWLRHMSDDQANVIVRADGNAKRSGDEKP